MDSTTFCCPIRVQQVDRLHMSINSMCLRLHGNIKPGSHPLTVSSVQTHDTLTARYKVVRRISTSMLVWCLFLRRWLHRTICSDTRSCLTLAFALDPKSGSGHARDGGRPDPLALSCSPLHIPQAKVWPRSVSGCFNSTSSAYSVTGILDPWGKHHTICEEMTDS
ncbi:hypothetical protein BR93DRAFT_75187 [Coniochaeta sp. PMI_546]|nr:hypothetical protein BR93DRAFT_75187 [Coniochaeta sp. PMI_546]